MEQSLENGKVMTLKEAVAVIGGISPALVAADPVKTALALVVVMEFAERQHRELDRLSDLVETLEDSHYELLEDAKAAGLGEE